MGETSEPHFYRSFLTGSVIPNARAFAILIEVGELFVGNTLIAGSIVWLARWSRLSDTARMWLLGVLMLAAVSGILMALNFHLAAGGNHPWLIPKDGFDETVDLDAFLVMVQGAFAVFCGYLVLQIRRRASGERRTRRRSERCRHRGLNLHASPPAPSPPRTTRSEAQRFAGRLGLHVNEVMQFQRNYYAKLVDGNGNGATEVLVDPTSGLVSIEYGPAMICNTRYGMGRAAASMMGSYGISMMGGSGDSGMMGSRTQGSTSSTRVGSTMDGSESGGMMGGSGSGGMMGGPGGSTTQTPATSSANTAVSMADARSRAQRWLDANERA